MMDMFSRMTLYREMDNLLAAYGYTAGPQRAAVRPKGECRIRCYADPGECGYSRTAPEGVECTMYGCPCGEIHNDAYLEDGEE